MYPNEYCEPCQDNTVIPPIPPTPPPSCVGEVCVEIIATKCVRYDGVALVNLGIEAGSTMNATLLALEVVATRMAVMAGDLPVSDGSETKMLEGDNVTITGNGTLLSPYIITSTIPASLSELANDLGFITLADIPTSFSGSYFDLVDVPDPYLPTLEQVLAQGNISEYAIIFGIEGNQTTSIQESGVVIEDPNASSAYFNRGVSIVADKLTGNLYNIIYPNVTGSGILDYNLPLSVNGATADDQGNIVVATSRPYTVYTALLTQIGSSVPTEEILEDGIGNVTYSYAAVGTVIVTFENLSGIPPVVFIGNGNNASSLNSIYISNAGSVYIQMKSGGVYANGGLTRTPIEIRVYN